MKIESEGERSVTTQVVAERSENVPRLLLSSTKPPSRASFPSGGPCTHLLSCIVRRRSDNSRMLSDYSDPTRLEFTPEACAAYISADGRALKVYKNDVTRTKWGGHKVEGYIKSTPGSRFKVGIVNNDWPGDGPHVAADVVLDGTCMAQNILSLVSFLSSLTPMGSRASWRSLETKLLHRRT
jgi:hypothetical protein